MTKDARSDASQMTGSADDRLAGGAPSRILLAGFCHNGGSPDAMNGPVHTASAGQLVVGGIDDDVRLLEGDISDNQFQSRAGDLDFHSPARFMHPASLDYA